MEILKPAMIDTSDLNLTDPEILKMEEFEKRVSGELNLKMYDETYLLYRMLKARNWDIDSAEDMLKKWLKWRKDNFIDTNMNNYKPPEFLEKYSANARIGYDKESCPVYYIPVGEYDATGITHSAKSADIEKTILLILEACELYIETEGKKLKRRLPGYTVILDMQGLTFANATNKKGIELVIHSANLQQNYYPDRLKTAYVINVSPYFTFPYNIVKNFLDPVFFSKFRISGTDGWQEELLKVIDADQLPMFLGGTRTDPDGNPLCKTLVNQGGKVDEKYYIHKSKKSLANSPGVKKVVLARASFTEIDLEIKEMGSLIEWEFETKVRDIGFGLFYKEMDGEEEKITELISLQRLETDEFSETGMYKCEKAGKYVILFDNSYSWVRSKELFYRITIVRPEEMENQMKL